MTEENTVSPDAETQNPAPVTDENTEVVTPETDTQTEKPETQEDPAAKSLKRLERRIDRVTAARYQAEAERERRAKVIAAEGEFEASIKLTEAARKLQRYRQ